MTAPAEVWLDKTVLITGGTGTLGQALVHHLLDGGQQPKKVVVLARDEVKQRVMKRCWPDPLGGTLRYFIGDVRDVDRLRQAFAGVDYVIHTAALKQVDTAEYNPDELIRTNVEGTRNVVRAAVDAGVEKVVFTSSDKAVNPLNHYGATKMVAEKLVVRANAYGAGLTTFAATRWGNVIRSRGSVFDTWDADPAGPIRYSPDHRYWLTRDEAALTIGVAFTLMSQRGGEIFVPRMQGANMETVAMAYRMATPGAGIRPLEAVDSRFGDKHAEVLFTDQERARAYVSKHGPYVSLPPDGLAWDATHGIWLDGDRALGLEAVPDSATCERWDFDELVGTIQEDMALWP